MFSEPEVSDRLFFGTSQPPWSGKIINREEYARLPAEKRAPDWPPLNWETSSFPTERSLEGLLHWLDFLDDLLSWSELEERVHGGRWGISTSTVAVRDTARFIRVLREMNCPEVQTLPSLKYAHDYTVLEARDTLEQIRRELRCNPAAVGDGRRISTSSTAPLTTSTDPVSDGAGKKGKKGKCIDAKMLKVLADNHDSHGWSARQWADHLGCSPGTVKETKSWKERLKMARAIAAAAAAEKMEQGKKSGRKKPS